MFFTVKEMREAISDLREDEPLAVIFFRKSDLEDVISQEITLPQWENIATKFQRDESLDMEAASVIREYAYEAIGESND